VATKEQLQNQRRAQKVVAAFLEERLVEQFRYFLQRDRAVRRQLKEAALRALDNEESFLKGQPIHDKLAYQLPVHFAHYWLIWTDVRKHLVDKVEEYGWELSPVVRHAIACREEHKIRLPEGVARNLAREINHGTTLPMGEYLVSSDSFFGELQMTRNWERLGAREQRVMRLRLGLDDKRPRTHKEVGAVLNVTHERVREIEAKALRTLRIGFSEPAAAED
jgi:hypothetical protein